MNKCKTCIYHVDYYTDNGYHDGESCQKDCDYFSDEDCDYFSDEDCDMREDI